MFTLPSDRLYQLDYFAFAFFYSSTFTSVASDSFPRNICVTTLALLFRSQSLVFHDGSHLSLASHTAVLTNERLRTSGITRILIGIPLIRASLTDTAENVVHLTSYRKHHISKL